MPTSSNIALWINPPIAAVDVRETRLYTHVLTLGVNSQYPHTYNDTKVNRYMVCEGSMSQWPSAQRIEDTEKYPLFIFLYESKTN